MEALNKDIARDLRRAAAGYGRAGMGLMLAPTMREHNAQAAIGNLAIATELLLKAFMLTKPYPSYRTQQSCDVRFFSRQNA